MLVALWTYSHIYKGITGDAELYAVQATSRLHPALATDLYLQNVSQDQFTIFSPVYAWFIQRWGLPHAALVLCLASNLTFLVAGGLLARRLSTRSAAFLAVAALILIKGSYGGSGVFSYAESYLTARSVAEALIAVAIACHSTGRRVLALLIAVVAMAFHPIMALPGLLLLLCLWVRPQIAAIGAGLGIAVTASIALVACVTTPTLGAFRLMDPLWLEVVRERSQFLFLQLWSFKDWTVNIRPLLYLTAYAFILEGQARQLCMAALLVGGAGLAVAALAGGVGPVALLVQGQAWRWMWVAGWISVLLLAPAVMTVWRDETCGPLCALLLVLGWTFAPMNPILCGGLSLFLWIVRIRIRGQESRFFRWAAAALAAVALWQSLAKGWTFGIAPSPDVHHDGSLMSQVREVLGVELLAVLGTGLLSFVILRTRSFPLLTALAAVLAAGTVVALPSSFKTVRSTAGDPEAFADWRSAIPASSVVYVLPAHNSAAFAWFTLERPSYLTVDQSAGVVFSRATALEVKRRSDVLSPLNAPDWRILSANRRRSRQAAGASAASSAPSALAPPPAQALTAAILVQICEDPIMNFVVAKERLDFDPRPHTGMGLWKDWNLYDCGHVRVPVSHP